MGSNKKLYYFEYGLFLILLYIYIFNPPFRFLPFSPKYFLYPLILLCTLFSKRYLKVIGHFKIHLKLLCLIVLYSLVRDFFEFKIVFFPINFLLLIEAVFLPISIIYIYSRIKPEGDLINEIIFVGVIASLFSLLMIANGGIGDFIRYKLLTTDEFTEAVAYRTFGLAENLTSSYGIVQGIIFSLALFYSIINKKYLLLLPFFLIAILFNARIGFAPVILSVIILNIFSFDYKRILGIFSFVFAFYLLYQHTSLFEDYKKTIEWGLDFFTQSFDFASSGTSSHSTFSVLFDDMAVFPNNAFSWMFGSAENLFISPTRNTDIGYLIQLNYGGLLYLALLGLVMLNISKYFFKLNKISRLILLLIILTILITNIKGNIFIPVGSIRLMMLIIFILVLKMDVFSKNVISLRLHK